MNPERIPLTPPDTQEPDPTKGVCKACRGTGTIKGRYVTLPCGSAYHDPSSKAYQPRDED